MRTILVAWTVVIGVALVGSDVAAQRLGTKADAVSDEEGEAIEKAVMAEIPDLAPADDPKRIEQLWTLAKRLTTKRAYCRAVKYLDEIEALAGEAIADNRSAAAQSFFMCARTRLGQDDVAGAREALARARALAPNRPEYRDLDFKLALVRAKAAMETEDIAAMREGLAEARQLGVDMGPGRGDRLADWAIPVMHDAIGEIAAWSYELLQQDKNELADEASKLCIEFNPRDKIARQVQRELALTGALVPAIAAAIAGVLLLGFGWRLWRYLKLRRTALTEVDLDEEIAGPP